MSDEKPAGSNSVKSNKNGPRGRFKGKREKFDHKAKYGTREKKTTTMLAEIERLKEQYAEIDPSTIETFRDLPLSQKTLKGLKDGEYEKPTEIQRESIGLALQGNDILGAAKTGSGKTLAFLIPMLESLYRVRWVTDDGVGALVISPTRELAYQTFEVLKGLGKFHDFSAGLVIGGKFVKEEAERINRTNIVICTPGRLLQHMDETFNFNADNLQILVLDEADRILDMGFAQTMNAIIENLPTQRQTMLFSATQTKSVKDLARLSLKDPVYVSVHEHSKHSTPAKLEQSYIVCELQEKFNVLWSFVKNHLKTKTLVFLSSCKQVRFIHEVFRRLRPGVTVLALHGSMQQLKRMAMYDEFCRKEFCVLFATDIAARGLDFPEVNWVVQFDCPEDANTYIHRAGRTARYQDDGEALLMLTPSEEEGMLRQFQMKKIPINGIKVNSTKLWDLKPRLESLLASDVELKEFAQRAFVSYVKSVYMMKDKEVFDVSKLDTDSYALSLGLAIPPRIRFLQKEEKRKKEAGKKLKLDAEGILEMFKATAKPIAGTKASKTGKPAKQKDDESGSESEEDASEGDAGSEAENSSDEESGSGSESESGAGSSSEEDSESDDEEKEQLERSKKGEKLNFDVGDEDLDDILTMKSVNKLDDSDKEEEEIKEEVETKTQAKKKAKSLTKAKLAKLAMKKNIKMNIKMVFDEQGEVVDDKMKKPQVPLAKEEEEYEGGINIELAQKRMREEDKIDRRTERERIHKMHREKRLKEKAKKKGEKVKDEAKEECNAVLGADDEDKGNPLDFIPDPDKVYGPQQSDSEEDDNEDSDSQSEEEGPPAKKARKPTGKKQTPQRRKDESDDSGEESEEDSEGDSEPDMPMDTGLSLVDDEALALQFLQS